MPPQKDRNLLETPPPETDYSALAGDISGEIRGEISAARTPSDIVGDYKAQRGLVQEAAGAGRELVKSKYGTEIEEAQTKAQQEKTSFLESRRGFATNTAALRQLEESGEKRVRQLKKDEAELLALGKIEEASALSDLYLREQESITSARQQHISNLFGLSAEMRAERGFETPEQERAGDAISNLMQTAPDAGILPTDDFATASEKYRNSVSYQQNKTLGELQLEKLKKEIEQIGAPTAKDIEAQEAADKVRSEALSTVSFIDSILKDPTLKRATGPIQARIPALDVGSKRVQNQIEQLRALLTLGSRQKLQGQGAITERENDMLERASTSLERALTHTDFLKEIAQVRGVFAHAAGMPAPVKVTDPATGEYDVVNASREGYDNLVLNGYVVEFAAPGVDFELGTEEDVALGEEIPAPERELTNEGVQPVAPSEDITGGLGLFGDIFKNRGL